MSRPKTPMNWTAAVAHVLGGRERDREQAFDTDANEVFKALQALVATGRCLATASHGSYLPLTGVRRASQSRMGFNGNAHRDDKLLAGMAIALEGTQGSWIANAARLTYLPPRRGAPAEKAVFHLLLGERHGSPFINDAEVPEPQLHLAKGAWVLLTEANLDVPSLLRGDVDPADRDSLGEAVRGRPRASYVPLDERVRKETALAAVKDAYLAHRGQTPRALQQDDIDVIVRTGLEHGLLINLDLVHAATENRGSPNSVYPKLADAMRRLAPGRTTADDVDPALATLWEQLRTAAVASADEKLVPQRAELDLARDSLATERNQLKADREQDARAAVERQQQHERLIQELEQARERKEQRDQEQRRHEHQVQGLQVELRQANDTITSKSHELLQLNRDNARMTEHINQLDKEFRQFRTEHQKLQHAYDANLPLAKEHPTLQMRLAQAEQGQVHLQTQLAAAETQLTTERDHRRQAETQCAASQARLDVLEETYARLRDVSTSDTREVEKKPRRDPD